MDYSKTNTTKTGTTKTGATKTSNTKTNATTGTTKTNTTRANKSTESKKTVNSNVKKITTSASNTTTSAKKTGGTRKKSNTESLVSDVLGQIITAKTGDNTASKKTNRTSYSKSKKRNSGLPIFLGIFLFLGALCGFIAMKVLCKNDLYEMVAYQGSVDIVITNTSIEDYDELGVKCVAFGKDYSDKVEVKYYYRNSLSDDAVEVDGVDKEKDGIYYAEYVSPSAKYKFVKLIRKITVLREEDNVA